MPPKKPPYDLSKVKVAMPAPGTIIRFDDVGDRTVVNQQYVSKGVRFRSITSAPTYADAYARAYHLAESASNVISVTQNGFPGFDLFYGGAVEAIFTRPQRIVSIRARPELLPEPKGAIVGNPYLEAFDTGGAVLSRVEFPLLPTDPNWRSWQRIMFVSSQADIGSVRFSSAHQSMTPTVLGLFDRLYFADKLLPLPVGLGAYLGP